MKKLAQLVMLLSFLFIYTASAQAAQWEINDVSSTHTWTISFNDAIDEQSFLKHAKLRDSKLNLLSLQSSVKINKNTITIAAPADGYKLGQTYTLVIPASVKSTNGVNLKEATVFTFSVNKEDAPVVEEELVVDPPLLGSPAGKAPEEELVVDELTEQENELAKLINEYRQSLGLPALTISKSLTTVAREHVKDSNAYAPENGVDSRGQKCNLHSWSTNGRWSPVCYTADHAYADKMWEKPRELTSYPGNGYEISVSSSRIMVPTLAVNLWKASAGHEAVIAGRDGWDMLTTMGVAIYGKYSHIWFGSDEDPAGYYEIWN